jgi:Pyrimidine dimer DNA glycosylase
MNIFFLDKDPKKAASYLYNKHLSKMQLETAQIICTCCYMNNIAAPYRPTHKNHPLVLWTAESKNNLEWLLDHAIGMNLEWTTKGKKEHSSYKISMEYGKKLLAVLPTIGLTGIPIAKNRYELNDAVNWYRNYYLSQKSHIRTKQENEVIFE